VGPVGGCHGGGGGGVGVCALTLGPAGTPPFKQRSEGLMKCEIKLVRLCFVPLLTISPPPGWNPPPKARQSYSAVPPNRRRRYSRSTHLNTAPATTNAHSRNTV